MNSPTRPHGSPQEGTPRPDDVLADLPLSDLSRMLGRGEITSRRLVEIYLGRIARLDGPDGINSYITVMAEEALRAAEEADEMTKRGESRGPLHGLPFAVKDNIETKGVRTTAGSRILASWVPSEDAHVVRRLKKAGAIILGKTNMHEFALGATNDNPHYGPARNPYDLSRITGGSSGGSAAAAAAALCAAAIGTDTGGSVRIPAGLCGVVGLKPTLGRVGRGGVIPLSFSRDCIGPITRTVLDAAIVLEVIAGRDPRDPESSARPVPRYASVGDEGLTGKRFGLPRRFIAGRIHPDTQEVMDESVRLIEHMGGIVEDVEIDHIDLAHDADFNVVGPEAVYLIEAYLRKIDPRATIAGNLDLMGEDVRRMLAHHAGVRGAKPVPGHVYVKTLREECGKMKEGFRKAMSGVDALLFPTTPFPACRIGEDPGAGPDGKRITFHEYIRNCVPVSVVGYPAVSVPAGHGKTGLPVGLEMVARPWEEHRLLDMAYSFEQTAKARRPPAL